MSQDINHVVIKITEYLKLGEIPSDFSVNDTLQHLSICDECCDRLNLILLVFFDNDAEDEETLDSLAKLDEQLRDILNFLSWHTNQQALSDYVKEAGSNHEQARKLYPEVVSHILACATCTSRAELLKSFLVYLAS